MGALSSIVHRTRILGEMQAGDVLLTWDNSLLSRIIGWFTRRDAPRGIPRYSHVEICYQRGSDVLPPVTLSAERRGLLSRSPIRYAPLRKRVHIYRPRLINAGQQSAIARWCQTLGIEDQGYDWLGAAHFVLDWVRGRGDQWYCSEAVVDILRRSGLHIWSGERPDDITPRELGYALHLADEWGLIADL